jgi:hypothetical protein
MLNRMDTAPRHASFFAAAVSLAVAGIPAAAAGFAGAGVDVAFVAPDGSVAVAGTLVEARVLSAIRSASENTGVAFPYLLAKAFRESGFDSSADAQASSAAGMFQFTRQTWIDLFSRYGETYGRGDLAARIARLPKGGFVLPEGEDGRRILDLRHDPELAAHLAAEYTRENRAILTRALGRKVTPEELYIAHFLGAQGALQLFRAVAAAPGTAAASLFPDAAASNPGLFYPPPGRHAISAASLQARLGQTFRREMVRFASLSPEVVEMPPAAAPRKSVRKEALRHRPRAEELRQALARNLLPGGGLSLPWLTGSLDGAEPVRLPLGPFAEAAVTRAAMQAMPIDDEAPVVMRVLPPSAARAALMGTRAAFERVPADRAAGAMPRLPGSVRFAAPMPPRPADGGAKVAGGALPRYEKTTPEIADAAPREGRPGV